MVSVCPIDDLAWLVQGLSIRITITVVKRHDQKLGRKEFIAFTSTS